MDAIIKEDIEQTRGAHLSEETLTELGYDAFLSVDRDTVSKVDLRKLSPRQKTLKLVRFKISSIRA